jgi:hypothetical protein
MDGRAVAEGFRAGEGLGVRALFALHSASQSDRGLWNNLFATGRALLLLLGMRFVLRTVMSFLTGAENAGSRSRPGGLEIPEVSGGLL